MPKKDKETEELRTGAINIEDIPAEDLKMPTRKGKYDWDSIGTVLKTGKSYLFGKDAKKNSILTGARRLVELKTLSILPRLAIYKNPTTETEQFILIPQKS